MEKFTVSSRYIERKDLLALLKRLFKDQYSVQVEHLEQAR